MDKNVEKVIEQRAQVRKAPQHELKNLRPHGIALVPRGANALVCVVMKADDTHGDEMTTTKLRLSPTAKSAITNAMQSHLQSLNSTFALLTGADEDEAAEVPVELVEMFKSAAAGLEALAKQYGKPMMDDEEKKRREKDTVEKAGRTFSKKNEEALRALALRSKEAAAEIEALLGPAEQAAATATTDVAKSVGVDASTVAKLIDEKLAPVLKSLDAAVEKMAPKPAPEARVIQASNGASTERQAPEVRPAPYDPRDLDSVFKN